MRVLFYKSQKLQHDTSGISDPDLFWWEMGNNGILYPTDHINEDDFHEQCREWMEEQPNLTQNTSLDEISLNLFTTQQMEIRDWFMRVFEKI